MVIMIPATEQFGLERELKADYDDFKHRRSRYQKEVDSITKLFRWEKEPLLGDVSPAYFVGRYDKPNHFVIFGINPGYVKKNNDQEEQENKKSLESYYNHHYEFFKFFQENELKSPYWKKFWLLFLGFKSHNTKEVYWDFLDAKVTGLNLIPYHSSRTKGMPPKFSKLQFGYLKYRLDLNVDFISPYRPKLLIFNGKPWKVLLIGHKLVNKFKEIPITGKFGKFNLYFFEYKGVKSVLFDKFLSSIRGLTHDQIRTEIADSILKEYPTLRDS